MLARLSVIRVLSERVRVRDESLTDTITKERERLHVACARNRKKHKEADKYTLSLSVGEVVRVIRLLLTGNFNMANQTK